MTAETVERDEVEILDPRPSKVELSDGTLIDIQPLKARQFFRLMRIVTRGGAQFLNTLRFGADSSAEEFGAQLLAVVVFAIPEAEDEAIEFIHSMILPPDLEDESDRFARERNDKKVAELLAKVDNPALEDIVIIIEQVIEREKDDLLSLGKRLRNLFALAQKTGQVPPTQDSSEGSPQPSTSSAPSTDGKTARSSASRSRASAKSSQPSEADES